jgi:hypothetical protein
MVLKMGQKNKGLSKTCYLLTIMILLIYVKVMSLVKVTSIISQDLEDIGCGFKRIGDIVHFHVCWLML